MRTPEDSYVRINKKQSRGIIIKNRKVLLMFRRKNGVEYYVFPGGHMRINEKPIETAIREIKEETTIDVKNIKPAFKIKTHDESELLSYYFVGEWKSGNPILSGEESREINKDNYYKPMWVDIEDMDQLILYPLMAEQWIKEYMEKSKKLSS